MNRGMVSSQNTRVRVGVKLLFEEACAPMYCAVNFLPESAINEPALKFAATHRARQMAPPNRSGHKAYECDGANHGALICCALLH